MRIINRNIFPELLKALPDQRVIVITGMRRVGKTTTLRWLLDQVPSDNKLYMDLERLDQRAVFDVENYDVILNYFRNLGLSIDQPLTVALDEFQNVKNIPSVVKYFSDHYPIKFILTGSSSFYLKNFFTESLAGRKIVFELFPLSFGEFLEFQDIPYRKRESLDEMRYDPLEYQRLSAFYEDFVSFGGLPGVVLEPKVEVKREILNDIFTSYINIDVRVMADFRKISELKVLLKALTARIGNKLDLSKLSQIIGISRPTLYEYLEFLEKTYIICRLPAYAGIDKSITLGKKLYFCDNGIASILGNPGDGALFENAIFNQLRGYGELAHLNKNNRYEIDFILFPQGDSPTALEVKYHPTEMDELKLKRIAQEHGLQRSWLIGRHATPAFDHFLWGGLIF
jgi:predicted AAA+ superfamily ATPase